VQRALTLDAQENQIRVEAEVQAEIASDQRAFRRPEAVVQDGLQAKVGGYNHG
jgi:hypothetical protein